MDSITLEELLQLTNANHQSDCVLGTVCALLEQQQPNMSTSDSVHWFCQFAASLRPALRSSSSESRRMALRLLSQLWTSNPENGGNDINAEDPMCSKSIAPANPIRMLYDAENCAADFQNYRQRASLFRRLTRTKLEKQKIAENWDDALYELTEEIVLDVLLAQYYEYLTLYWPLLAEVIESYAQKPSMKVFWKCFENALNFAWTALSEESTVQNADFGSYRVQLLRLLSKLPSAQPERHTHYLAPKLIALYRDEFMRFDGVPPVRKNTNEANISNTNEDQESSELNMEERNATKASVSRLNRGKSMQTMKAMLTIFAQFSNPRGVHREPEIHDIYYELFLVNEAEIQRGALGCLLTYKYAWLTPYKTHLEGILDEKRLREHLVLFGVDNRQQESSENSLLDEHRPELIPVLIRLLFGSLHTHVATRGKSKRLSIFRFLASCHSEELALFLRLLFGPLISLFEFDESGSFLNLNKTLEVLPAKQIQQISFNKLKSILGSLSDVFRFIGPSLDTAQLELLFSSIVLIGFILLQKWRTLREDDEEPSSTMRLLKNLRKLLFFSFTKFFNAFQFREQLPISAFSIFFQQFLCSLISDYNREQMDVSKKRNFALPFSVVRLFCDWAKIPRWLPLLNVSIPIKMDSDHFTTTPMALLYDQLECASSLKSPPMDILRTIYSLLDSQSDQDLMKEDDGGKIEPFSDIESALSMDQSSISNFGTRLALSKEHLDKLLNSLSSLMHGEQDGRRIQVGRIPSIYFELLSRISANIQHTEFGTFFAKTLLNYITIKGGILPARKPDKAVTMLNTLTRLSSYLENPLDSIDRLSLLFSRLNGRQLRESLTRMTCSLRANPQLSIGPKKLLDHLESIESWDPRLVEEPDADRRCEALLLLHDLYERRDEGALLDDAAAHVLPLMAHSHAHSMLQHSDVSLRGIAANSLRQLIRFSASLDSTKFDSIRFLHIHLIPLILRGLSAENEPVRHEFVQCLAMLVRHFPEDAQLAPLRIISCANGTDIIDPDLDFFECATHIQLHRRQRAFHRVAERLNSGELSIAPSTLLRFIMPILEPYLMETASSRSALADQALFLFTAILRKAPWSKYNQILGNYLRLLGVEEERTKGAVRVILAALDGFHFDLRNVGKEQNKEENGGRMEVEEKEEEHGDEEEMEQEQGEEEEGEEEEEVQMEHGTSTADDSEKCRIFGVVVGKLLPQLRECLHPQKVRSSRQNVAQTNNSWEFEEMKLARAPMTLAIVKLLKWLPEKILDEHLHGLVHTLNSLLMSRSQTIRQAGRKLLEQLVRLLGPAKLSFVIRELKQLLSKGFQVHVMTVTVAALIGTFGIDQLTISGDKLLEPCLKDLLDICQSATFGNAQNDQNSSADRPESKGVPEAKTSFSKAAEILGRIGRFVTNTGILEEVVIDRMSQIAESAPQTDTIRKLSEWLRLLSVGMRDNPTVSSDAQLKWALHLLHVYIPRICSKSDDHQNAKKEGLRPTSCLLIPREPKRLGVIQRVAPKSKMFIFVEFAFQLLADQLAKLQQINNKKNNEDEENGEHAKNEESVETNHHDSGSNGTVLLFEKFVPLIIESLKLKYDKIIALCLRSLFHLFKHPSITMKDHFTELSDRLFLLLTNCASMGLTGGRSNTIELQQQLFKCLTQLIKDAPLAVLSSNRLQLLLNYVEAGILDEHRQETAFGIVKAMINRRIEDKSVTNIIEYLSETLVTSHSSNIRNKCRQTVLLYLLVHPRGRRKYERWMDFFLNQCEYELEDGRLSALEMIHSIINEFTPEAHARYALLVFIKLCSRLVNEQAERCQDKVAVCLRSLLCSLPAAQFNDCLAATRDWLDSSKPSVHLLALRAFSQLVSSNSPNFDPASRKQIITRTCQAFTVPTQQFIGQSDITKLAYCKLFLAIVDQTPEELVTEILPVKGQQMKQEQRRKKKAVVIQEVHSIWRQFFVNLEHCLARSQHNSLHLPLSLGAGAFLLKWIDNSKCLEAIMTHLNGKTDQQGELPDTSGAHPREEYSFLCSLCLSLTTQFDPKKKKMSKKEEEEENSEKEEGEEENKEEEEGQKPKQQEATWNEGEWHDQLAEQASRSLVLLMPSLSADHFALVCKRLSKFCWMEAVKESYRARKRLSILKMIGMLVSKVNSIESPQFGHLASYFLPLIYREISRKSLKFTDELHSIATEVSGQFRRKLGDREFSLRLAQCQQERSERIQERKKNAKALFMVDPAAAVAEKQRRHESKKRSKKRKLDAHKPYREFKRRRKEK